jgi:hypothetical protein
LSRVGKADFFARSILGARNETNQSYLAYGGVAWLGNHMARKFPLYSNYTALGWRVVKQISFDVGETSVSVGALVHVFDSLGAHHGYQLADDSPDKSIPSDSSSGALTAWESAANAGLYGISATKNLRENERVQRKDLKTNKALPAEDFIELAEAKVRMQTCSANRDGDKAPRVYPTAMGFKKRK